jgi:hypothetical protein
MPNGNIYGAKMTKRFVLIYASLYYGLPFEQAIRFPLFAAHDGRMRNYHMHVRFFLNSLS